jgi:hypothetical protein
VLVQTLRVLDGEPREFADDMYVLMLLNMEARAARFAALREEDETSMLVLTARIEAERIARETIEEMLGDATGLSRRLDELAEAAPEGEAE